MVVEESEDVMDGTVDGVTGTCLPHHPKKPTRRVAGEGVSEVE
jgi:hypothetical protein